MFTTGMTGKLETREPLVSAMVPLLRNTTLSISFSNSWKPILGIAAILFRSGITKLSKKQMGCSRAPFRPCLMSGVLMGEIYLDATLTQRSNDMLVAHHINAMQYVALQMMIAKHFGWKVGKFFYFINNLHIYDNQFEQAQELLRREPSNCQPRLVLNVPDGTNFFDIKAEDFELVDYDPVKPQLKFDLAI